MLTRSLIKNRLSRQRRGLELYDKNSYNFPSPIFQLKFEPCLNLYSNTVVAKTSFFRNFLSLRPRFFSAEIDVSDVYLKDSFLGFAQKNRFSKIELFHFNIYSIFNFYATGCQRSARGLGDQPTDILTNPNDYPIYIFDSGPLFST